MLDIDAINAGDYIIYVNGDRYELGRVKSVTYDGAFVCYHEGQTAAKTSFADMHLLANARCIEKTSIGGGVFFREGL